MWQRLVSRKNSWDFAFLGKVIKKRGRFTVVYPSDGDRRVAVVCLTLITPNQPEAHQPVRYVFCKGVVW
jgi:hypothetical protein